MSAAEQTPRGRVLGSRKCALCRRIRVPTELCVVDGSPTCFDLERCRRDRETVKLVTAPQPDVRYEAIEARLALLRELLATSREALRMAEAHVDLLESMLAGEAPP